MFGYLEDGVQNLNVFGFAVVVFPVGGNDHVLHLSLIHI